MRNILFRGKRIDNGEWITSRSIEVLERGGRLRVCMPEARVATIVVYDKSGNIESIDNDACEVCPDTVGQCTGLTDRNGLNVFEGDVLERAPGEKFLVRWSEEYARFELLSRSGAAFNVTIQWQCELLGNIYDDPWLFREMREAEEEDKQC